MAKYSAIRVDRIATPCSKFVIEFEASVIELTELEMDLLATRAPTDDHGVVVKARAGLEPTETG